MPRRFLYRILTAVTPTGEHVPDDELLRRFVTYRDSTAFELLVQRHADAVWSACRRLLRSEADAEDAFQAAFMILARKAVTVRGACVGGWLHRVAVHAALKLRARATRIESTSADQLNDLAASPANEPDTDIAAVVQEEIAQLPERYQLPVVLCELEGRTYAEAAQLLGCPIGSVSGRLSRARALLRDRLTRRGLAPVVTLTAVVAPASSVHAVALAVTGPVAASPEVSALVEGILYSMRFSKQKLGILAIAMLGLAGTIVAFTQGSRQPSDQIPIVDRNELAGNAGSVSNEQDRLQAIKRDVATVIKDVEKVQEYEYIIEGEKKKGTCLVLSLEIGDGEKMEFVRITKGKFTMGAPKNQKFSYTNTIYDEHPHEVEITNDFYMGKFTVTQGQYKAIVGENPSENKGDLLPVENVSWENAAKYCELLSKKLNRRATLPSEAQWEYACRAGTTTLYHYGSRSNGELANSTGTILNEKHPERMTVEVGTYPPNPWGLHDMHGNVFQWCEDWYGPYQKLEGTPDPIQLTKSVNCKVLRGGSFYPFTGESGRSSSRSWIRPTQHNGMNGFRVCLSLEK